MWRHMACNKLEIDEQLAWSYFEFFDAIQETNSTERIAKAERRAELDVAQYKQQRHVSTIKGRRVSFFRLQILFLSWSQHTRKISDSG